MKTILITSLHARLRESHAGLRKKNVLESSLFECYMEVFSQIAEIDMGLIELLVLTNRPSILLLQVRIQTKPLSENEQ